MVLHTLASKLPKPEKEKVKPEKSKAQLACEGKGGTWDGKKCILPEKPAEKPELLQAPGMFREDEELKGVEKGKEIVFNPDGTVSVTRGGETVTLTKEEYKVAELGETGIITRKVRQAQALDPAVRGELPEVRREQSEEFLEAVRLAELGLPLSALQEQLLEEEGSLDLPETKTLIDTIAELGVVPSVFIGNIIADITGGKKGTAEELADTTGGKILGLTTASLFSFLLVAHAAPLVGDLIRFTGTKLTGGAVSTAASAKVGATAVGAVTAVGGFILGPTIIELKDRLLQKESAQELQGAITTTAQMAPTIVGLVNTGGISKAQGIAEINQQESDLNIIEGRIQQAIILDPSVRTSGQVVDILKDIEDSRNIFRESRANILASTPEFDAGQTIFLLETLQTQAGLSKEELGLLKDVLEV